MSFDISVIIQGLPLLAKGLGYTLLICGIALPVGFVIGTLCALARLSGRRWLKSLVMIYVEIIRNTPFLIQIYLIFFVLPQMGIRLEGVVVGIITLAIYCGAYFAENVRGAIQTIPRGQTEAAEALGISYWTTQRRVIFPQMLSYLIPTTSNLTLTLIKESAVLSVITVPELTYQAQVIIGRTFAPVEGFTAIALIYWGLNSLVAFGLRRWERHASRYLTARDHATSGDGQPVAIPFPADR
ncbi:amino acid ABC transporter permease [Paracoccus sp. (in: a-proteobacteria)]|uniref:amino acid ABC transporter permease n=1 Tax=Paracoccus sp. TaxID=267 RepID=UPI0032201BCF